MKGIILAGGSGTRLHPLTLATSKQLLPVGDKPMIYYPLSALMLADIRDILIISTPADLPQFRRLFGDGADYGLNLTYCEQAEPNGIAEAIVIGASHIGDDPVALVLGDNIYHGPSFYQVLADARAALDGCVLFGYRVGDPRRYAVSEVDDTGRLLSIEEKPERPRSNQAVTGLYFYDNAAVDVAKNLRPSTRGELEITDLNRWYVERGRAHLVNLGRGFAWLDAGTPESLLQAGHYVCTLQERQGIRIACIEEIALRMGFITGSQCHRLGARIAHSSYGKYVMAVAEELATA
ncbi:glucose-1-phosphate thymidylyltransferase RfbA [Streptomyces sp. NPDC058632]|uniref:glucose-1-phosphate thymidylyltransferase RfbA n=1 Tax=unclassified Streptomyces TaxID=2593676 RepID=UPI00365A4B2C